MAGLDGFESLGLSSGLGFGYRILDYKGPYDNPKLTSSLLVGVQRWGPYQAPTSHFVEELHGHLPVLGGSRSGGLSK